VDVGRGRLISIAALVLAALLAVVLVAVWVRGRRRRRGGGGVTSGADPYATLAATPDPDEGAEVRETGARGAEPD